MIGTPTIVAGANAIAGAVAVAGNGVVNGVVNKEKEKDFPIPCVHCIINNSN